MKILCCLCGTSIDPNDAAMCIDCLRAQFDITGGIERNGEVVQCRKCERWHIKQDLWTYHALESSGLMSACLRKIAGLSNGKTKLIHAAWVWTEPHCDRLKISVEVEHGVLDGKVQLRQTAVIEFVVKHKQCMECIREATDHSWGAMIQIRQRVGHKQSLFLLEHLLTQAGLQNLMISITVCKEGLDLFFKARNQAEIVVNFISSHMPVRVKKSQKLISRDQQSNFSRYEITYHCEIAPLCKGDLVVTSKELSGCADLMVVTKLSSSVHLISPMTLNKQELNSQKIFCVSPKPLVTLLTTKNLTTFVILDINPIVDENHSSAVEKLRDIKREGGLLAEAEIARESDLGGNDTSYRVLTHLGHLLQAGDTVLGYDLSRATIDDVAIDTLNFEYPDVVLVRKVYPDKLKKASKKHKRRTRRGKAKQEKPVVLEDENEADITVETDTLVTVNGNEGDLAMNGEIQPRTIVQSKKMISASVFGWTGGDDEEYQAFHRRLAEEEEDDEEEAESRIEEGGEMEGEDAVNSDDIDVVSYADNEGEGEDDESQLVACSTETY